MMLDAYFKFQCTNKKGFIYKPIEYYINPDLKDKEIRKLAQKPDPDFRIQLKPYSKANLKLKLKVRFKIRSNSQYGIIGMCFFPRYYDPDPTKEFNKVAEKNRNGFGYLTKGDYNLILIISKDKSELEIFTSTELVVDMEILFALYENGRLKEDINDLRQKVKKIDYSNNKKKYTKSVKLRKVKPKSVKLKKVKP